MTTANVQPLHVSYISRWYHGLTVQNLIQITIEVSLAVGKHASSRGFPATAWLLLCSSASVVALSVARDIYLFVRLIYLTYLLFTQSVLERHMQFIFYFMGSCCLVLTLVNGLK